MRLPLLALLTLVLGAAPAAGVSSASAAAPADLSPAPGAAAIRAADLMKTVTHLASPGFRGRLGGSPEYWRAAREIAGRFRRLGLAPGGDDGYLQHLDVEYDRIEACALSLLPPGRAERPLRLGPDFTCRGFTGSGAFTAPVVFAGYGLSAPERGYDDYAGLDARGKIVLAFKEPPPFTVDSAGWGEAPLPRPKGLVAAEHGALGLLVVSRPNQKHPQRPIGSTLEGEGREDGGFPRLQVDDAVADSLLAGAGVTLAALESLIDSTRAPRPLALATAARVGVRARYAAHQPSVNVVGILEGTDPALRHQYVVLGAHLDHVGSQGDIYFPGANDNASGSATVVAIAEAFARAGARPRRSLVFALFTSEEAGLNGSKHFVEAPPVPPDSIVAYFNFDCVGHGDSIEVGGGKEYPKLWALARAGDAAGARLLVGDSGRGGGADAAPFERAHIPNLYFASRFSYTHLHLTSDTPATLSPPLLEAIARLGYETAWRVAQGDYTGE